MDAHSFRIIGQELLALLDRARVEKIHGPVSETLVFSLFAGGRKRRLVFHRSRSRPMLFFSAHSLANPARPQGTVMRLRKHVAGKRLGKGVMDWSRRSIAFPVLEQGAINCWLFVDLREGVFLPASLPPEFGREPAWPEEEVFASLCSRPSFEGAADTPRPADGALTVALPQAIVPHDSSPDGLWQAYSVLTPLLRETLAALDVMEGRALMVDLEAGGGELFVYADTASDEPALYTAWPLPEVVLRRRSLRFLFTASRRYAVAAFDYPFAEGTGFCTDGAAGASTAVSPAADYGFTSPKHEQKAQDALDAVALVDGPFFFRRVAQAPGKESVTEEKRGKKRLKRLAQKLAQEEERLREMSALKRNACLLQAEMWRFDKDERLAEVELADPERPGILRRISLDPLLSVRENMQRMFHQAGRGERGLSILQQRRKNLFAVSGVDEGNAAGNGNAVGVAGNTATDLSSAVSKIDAQSASGLQLLPQGFFMDQGSGKKGSKGKKSLRMKDIAVFRSSDGYLLLRGKNAEGNQALLKATQPYDLWMHVREGSSAHLVIRRAHAADEVPERTLREAGVLVGRKSRFREDVKADIMVAYVKNVRPVKGARPGTVRVDQELLNLTVSLAEGNEAEFLAP